MKEKLMWHAELTYIRSLPELAPLFEHADHVDVKTVLGSVSLRTFLAHMFSFQPTWVTALYAVRAIFVRFLGMRQRSLPLRRPGKHLTPETIPMQEGQRVAFFKVRMAKEDQYWIAEAKDTHLNAILGVVVEPLPDQLQKRFHVITIVSYNNWAGPLYFNVIRPFHHLVVGSMALAGVRNYTPNSQEEKRRL